MANAAVPIRIRMRSVLTSGSDTDITEQQSEGVMLRRSGRVLLRFEEYLTEGSDEVTETTMHIAPGECEIKRRGQMVCTLRFVPQEEAACTYQVSGLIDIELMTLTHEYRLEESDDGVKLTLDYDMLISGGQRQHNRIELEAETVAS